MYTKFPECHNISKSDMASVVATIATTSDPNASLPGAPQISTNMDDTKVTHLRNRFNFSYSYLGYLCIG